MDGTLVADRRAPTICVSTAATGASSATASPETEGHEGRSRCAREDPPDRATRRATGHEGTESRAAIARRRCLPRQLSPSPFPRGSDGGWRSPTRTTSSRYREDDRPGATPPGRPGRASAGGADAMNQTAPTGHARHCLARPRLRAAALPAGDRRHPAAPSSWHPLPVVFFVMPFLIVFQISSGDGGVRRTRRARRSATGCVA